MWLERFATTDGERRMFSSPGLTPNDFRAIEAGSGDVAAAVIATMDDAAGDAVIRSVVEHTVAAYITMMIAQFGSPELAAVQRDDGEEENGIYKD